MKLLIVTKPILSNSMNIIFYCFRYQRADVYMDTQPAHQFDAIINLPCLKLLEDVGLNGFTNGYPLFVPINVFTLLSDVTLQCKQPPEKIVFLLNEQTSPEGMFIESIRKLKEKGFRFAIESVGDYDAMHPVIELCDFIMISFKRNRDGLSEYKRVSQKYRKHVFIATNVDDIATYEKIRFSGFGGFEGKYYSLPLQSKGHNSISPVKINRIQLINVVRKEDFSIEEVVKIVSRDPSLSISLLRLINSPYLGLSQKIKSIQQAIALLGQTEVRKWVTTATAGLLAEDKPQEITRISLLRAKFAENLARSFEMGIHAPALFLMGLFSILNVVLEVPMEKALKVIPVSDSIHAALVHGTGTYAPVLELVLSYEAADWRDVQRIIAVNNMNVEDVFKAYIDTVRWYDSVASMAAEQDNVL